MKKLLLIVGPWGIVWGMMNPGYYDIRENWLNEKEYEELINEEDNEMQPL